MISGVFQKQEAFKTAAMKSSAYNVWINGEKYSVGFDSSVFGAIQPGSTVEFDFTTNAKGYKNVVPTSVKVTGPPTTNNALGTPTGALPAVSTTDYSAVDRRSALETAELVVALVINHPNGPKTAPSVAKITSLVCAVADHFANYIKTGVMETMKAEDIKKITDAVKVAESSAETTV